MTLFTSYRTNASERLSMLRTDGNKIVNAYGTQITLRGTNLGGWLMQEGWMTPLGAGEIDHSFITKITTSASNEGHFLNMLLTQ